MLEEDIAAGADPKRNTGVFSTDPRVVGSSHPPPPSTPAPLFSYGGYVEKDWPPNARTANPVSC